MGPNLICFACFYMFLYVHVDIGGMDIQKQEIREAVELPLTHFDLYRQIGIDPPRGVLMFGPPGCGKTMLAKAVAHHTTGAIYLLFKLCFPASLLSILHSSAPFLSLLFPPFLCSFPPRVYACLYMYMYISLFL